MSVLKFIVCMAICVAVAGTALAEKAYVVDGGKTIHAPVVYKNLAVFIISGKETIEGADYVTLSEAMKNEWVVVHETGSVNQLSVENVTTDHTVVILAGAVVKGGKQDRVLSQDLVLKPKSGKTPIGSFCVEQSRWSQRGGEKLDRFGSNSVQVSGKGLRKAVKGGIGQRVVWEQVAKEQQKISKNVKSNVQANASPTSFQLAVESKELQKEAAKYRTALATAIKEHPGAIGYAVAINGEFSTADVYANRGLFRKMWSQHLASAVTEAISLLDEAKGVKDIDLKWRDEIFKEKSFTQEIQKKTAGENEYVADQNENYFRYNCVLPGEKRVALRMSYEKREKGESLKTAEQPQQLQQQRLNAPANRTQESRRDSR